MMAGPDGAARRPIRCALLTNFRHDWAAALTLACDDLEFVTLSRRRLGLGDAPNPFGLVEADAADVVLLTSYWHRWLTMTHPDLAENTMRVLETSAETVVGLDGTDYFELGFTPPALERVTTVIKFQGVFRDRDLYNYDVGPWHPGAIWSQKTSPKQQRYRDEDLEKIRLSVPCLLLDLPGPLRTAREYEVAGTSTSGRTMSRTQRRIRNVAEEMFSAAVGAAPIRARPLEVQCLATLTHVQRLDALRRLDGFSGTRGIDRIPVNVAGMEQRASSVDSEHARRALVAEATRRAHRRLGKVRYARDMCRHRVVVAPTGYGELGQRHGWAMRAGAALVCQDLGHVEMMFSLRADENVVFCRHDLSDLRPRVQELLDDEAWRRRIAGEGRRSFAAWASEWRSHLDTGIAAHIRRGL